MCSLVEEGGGSDPCKNGKSGPFEERMRLRVRLDTEILASIPYRRDRKSLICI